MKELEKVDPWLLAFRVVFTIGVLAIIAFIFGRSFQEGAVSNMESQRILDLMQRVLQKFTDRQITMHFVRKLAHFTEFTALGGMLQLCLRVYTRHYFRYISYPLLGGLMVAVADETIQLRMIGRSSSVVDVWLDFSGVCFGIFCALQVLMIFHELGWYILHDQEE